MEIAGTMSVPKSIARISTVERGNGSFPVMNSRNGKISGMLEESV
jgi:hypothetical protein